MDILITEKTLRYFLKTDENIDSISNALSESGPTVDSITKSGDETTLGIEVITNRVDSASCFGIAREAHAILSQREKQTKLENDPYKHPLTSNPSKVKLNINSEKESLVLRFTAVAIDNVNVKESDSETQNLLAAVNERSINNLVDITNEYRLLFGLPSHIFDKDKLALQSLTIREAKADEKMVTLDNSKIDLQPGDIIIEDGTGRIVDLCGCMGGKVVEVDEHTKNLLLIVPVYNPKSIRKTSLFHQKRTLAAQIFEKLPDTELAPKVLSLIADKIIKETGGHFSSSYFDLNNKKPEAKRVDLNLNWLEKFVGSKIDSLTVSQILSNLGFKNNIQGTTLTATVPEFRATDIETAEDLAEEITRIYGYQNITSTLPSINEAPESPNPIFALEKNMRLILSHLGFSESYNSSLISKKTISLCNLDESRHLRLTNALSEDLEYLRISLVPSALLNHQNNRDGLNSPVNIFEIANTYHLSDKPTPTETQELIFSTNQGLNFAKKSLEKLLIYNNFRSAEFVYDNDYKNYYNPKNTISVFLNKTKVGQLGQIKTSITRKLQLDQGVSVVELNLELLAKIKTSLEYRPISNFPDIIEDITINSTKKIGEMVKKISEIDSSLTNASYLKAYKNNHTFRLVFNAQNRNLTQAEVSLIKDKITSLFK